MVLVPTVGVEVDEGVRFSLEGKGGDGPLAMLGDGAPELLILPFEERESRRPLVAGGAVSTTGSGRGPSLRSSSASAWR